MLFEGAVVSIIKQHGGDYGLQKLFGTFGAVIFGPLSGVLIDFGHDYSGVIILYFCLRAATALCILKLDLNFKVIYFSWKLLKVSRSQKKLSSRKFSQKTIGEFVFLS